MQCESVTNPQNKSKTEREKRKNKVKSERKKSAQQTKLKNKRKLCQNVAEPVSKTKRQNETLDKREENKHTKQTNNKKTTTTQRGHAVFRCPCIC